MAISSASSAIKILSGLLKFGNTEQIEAANFLGRIEECRDAIGSCVALGHRPNDIECSDCNGSGECHHCGQECPECDGSGKEDVATCECLKAFTSLEVSAAEWEFPKSVFPTRNRT